MRSHPMPGEPPVECEVFDFILSSKRNLTTNVLSDWLRTRCVVTPTMASHETLARLVAELTQSFSDLNDLVVAVKPESRRLPVVTTMMPTTLSINELTGVAIEVRDHVKKQHGWNLTLNPSTDHIDLTVQYIDIDPTRTALAQRESKEIEVKLSIELDDVGNKRLVVRADDDAKGRLVSETIWNRVGQRSVQAGEPTRLSLAGVASPRDRNKFFLDIVSKGAGFRPVSCHSIRLLRVTPQDQSTEPETEGDDDDDDDVGEAESQVQAELSRATLSGDNIHETAIVRDLLDGGAGYEIAKIVLRVADMSSPPAKKRGKPKKASKHSTIIDTWTEYLVEVSLRDDGSRDLRHLVRSASTMKRMDDGNTYPTHIQLRAADYEAVQRKVEKCLEELLALAASQGVDLPQSEVAAQGREPPATRSPITTEDSQATGGSLHA